MKGFKKAWDDICGMDDKDIAEEITRLRAEVEDHARWLREMCKDYRLSADESTTSRRSSINGYIHELRAEVERLTLKPGQVVCVEGTCPRCLGMFEPGRRPPDACPDCQDGKVYRKVSE